ncbi:hypothetical protein [Streptomyces antibioticus]|uniref:hypothetical protein n=1 Tax=Streptomyces antibioticus TaxID=1890 RepID=UPI0033E878CC
MVTVDGQMNRRLSSFQPKAGLTIGESSRSLTMSAASSPVRAPVSYFSLVSEVVSSRISNRSLCGRHSPGWSFSSSSRKWRWSLSRKCLSRARVSRIVPGVMNEPHTRKTAFQRRKCEKAMEEPSKKAG